VFKDEKKGILILKMMTLELHYRQMEPVFEPLAEEIIKFLGSQLELVCN
jgi:hypothetical protein